jgi:hypothetical protein
MLGLTHSLTTPPSLANHLTLTMLQQSSHGGHKHNPLKIRTTNYDSSLRQAFPFPLNNCALIWLAAGHWVHNKHFGSLHSKALPNSMGKSCGFACYLVLL